MKPFATFSRSTTVLPPCSAPLKESVKHPEVSDGSKQASRRQRPKGAVRKRTPLKGKLQGKTAAWTKRNKGSGRFMGVKKSRKKFKGVRKEKKAA
jgi:hypothetical protein